MASTDDDDLVQAGLHSKTHNALLRDARSALRRTSAVAAAAQRAGVSDEAVTYATEAAAQLERLLRQLEREAVVAKRQRRSR